VAVRESRSGRQAARCRRWRDRHRTARCAPLPGRANDFRRFWIGQWLQRRRSRFKRQATRSALGSCRDGPDSRREASGTRLRSPHRPPSCITAAQGWLARTAQSDASPLRDAGKRGALRSGKRKGGRQ
jgi:hypothetical protein